MFKHFIILSLIFSTNSYAGEQKKALTSEQINKRLAALETASNKIHSEQATIKNPSKEQQKAWDFQLSLNFDKAIRFRIKLHKIRQSIPIVSTINIPATKKSSQKETAHFDWIEKLVKAF